MARVTVEKPYRGATPDPAEATREAMRVAKTGRLPLVEVFYSLQGEGLRTGQATVFARLAGCNLACDFCDTDFRVQETYAPEGLVEEIERVGGPCRWVCFTGGEPTLHDLQSVCDALHIRGYRIQMETNGTRPRPGWGVDHITVSPKQPQGGRLHPWYERHAAEFKYVVDGEDDLRRALDGAAHGRPTFVQPNALNPAAMSLCIGAVQAHPDRLRLSLQTHKFLHIR
ncbi:MAG: 7-carboxy-7-deazaguanine synthase QueE [Armatimonadetes bacterium]|nr:7-carboxy-7-deazaguanine synthase QueE [Armatimonadota bacterium]